ncbi:MAG: formate dehydrogenase accessory sulfurtransferase FdhD [Nitrososphaerota archaeon]
MNVAKALGVTLIGFARKWRMNIYSFPERILI